MDLVYRKGLPGIGIVILFTSPLTMTFGFENASALADFFLRKKTCKYFQPYKSISLHWNK